MPHGTCIQSQAASLLYSVTDLEFIAVFLAAYQCLSHLAGITVKLQSSTTDVVEANKKINEVKQFYKEIRATVDTEFYKVYTQAKRMAATVDVWPCKL